MDNSKNKNSLKNKSSKWFSSNSNSIGIKDRLSSMDSRKSKNAQNIISSKFEKKSSKNTSNDLCEISHLDSSQEHSLKVLRSKINNGGSPYNKALGNNSLSIKMATITLGNTRKTNKTISNQESSNDENSRRLNDGKNYVSNNMFLSSKFSSSIDLTGAQKSSTVRQTNKNLNKQTNEKLKKPNAKDNFKPTQSVTTDSAIQDDCSNNINDVGRTKTQGQININTIFRKSNDKLGSASFIDFNPNTNKEIDPLNNSNKSNIEVEGMYQEIPNVTKLNYPTYAKNIQYEPWYHGYKNNSQIRELLKDDGDFAVFRKLRSSMDYVIGFNVDSKKVMMIPITIEDGQVVLHHNKVANISLMIQKLFFEKIPLYVDDNPIYLKNPVTSKCWN